MNTQKLPIKNKTILQILSFLSAIVLWFVITHTEDPVITVTLNNIPLAVSDLAELHKKELIFTNEHELPNISISVRGKRSDIRSILNSVNAKIDLSDITNPGEYTKDLAFEVPNSSVMIVKKKTESVTVAIEQEIKKEIPVHVLQSGTHDMLVKCTPNPQTITVSGSSYDVSRIKEALVTLDVSDIENTTTKAHQITLADETHTQVNPLHASYTNFSLVNVTSVLYQKKYAKIELNPDINPDDYHISVKGFSKDTIEIGIPYDSKNEYNTIYVEFANKNMSGARNEYKMKPIIPDNIYCPTSNDEIIMTAEIRESSGTTASSDATAENTPDK